MTPFLSIIEKLRAAGRDRLVDTIVELTREGCDCLGVALLEASPHPPDEIEPAIKEASRRLEDEGQVALARLLYDPTKDPAARAASYRAGDSNPAWATYDRAWAAFLAAGHRPLITWVKDGSDPEKLKDLERIRFRWSRRHGATLRTATGRMVKFRLQRARSTSTSGVKVIVARPRQPRHRKFRPSAAGDRGAADPEPPGRKAPPDDEAGGAISYSPDDDRRGMQPADHSNRIATQERRARAVRGRGFIPAAARSYKECVQWRSN